MYGCEVFGVADSMLEKARSKVAKAASPEACGKNPELALVAIDADNGTLDPAFQAHVGPIRHWALAVWDSWFSQESLSSTFVAAKKKVQKAGDNMWKAVSGPATALVATIQRLGWTMESHSNIISDIGQPFDLLLDPPVVIARAAAEGVRRWRWKAVGRILPGLIPNRPDAGTHTGRADDLIIGCFKGASKLLSGKGCPKYAGPVADLWYRKMRGDLASGMSGGQWTQTRKAGVPAFAISDSQCQLCHKEPGTILHRFNCCSTVPPEGWPGPPAEAVKALNCIGAKRREILKQRGFLVLRLPASKPNTEGVFQWIVDPMESNLIDEATWYFDGSMLNGRWKALRVTGFGVAVVAESGALIGHGLGWPPSWVTTAAAAEAWALSVVLSLVPFPPQLRTDCLALLQTAKEGTQKATHHSKPLARIWKRIAESMDVNVSELVVGGKLVWFPAHLTHKAIGEAKGSNGRRLSAVDWRANRLVDKLAKAAAMALQHSKHILGLLPSAEAAAAHATCLLGIVTHRANNHEVTTTDKDGRTLAKTLRDSTDRPKAKRATSEPPAVVKDAAPPPRQAPAVPRPTAPWKPPSAAVLAKREGEATLARRVSEIGSSLRSSSAAPAQLRTAQLLARIRAKN